MKQRNNIIILALICCLCFVLMTSCFQQEQPPVDYTIAIDEGIEHGTVQCERETAQAGETITVTAEADDDYQLVSITVNGEIIDGYSFVMPEEDVVISATFKLSADLVAAVPAGALELKAQSAGGANAKANMLLTFTEAGVKFEAYVEDSTLIEKDGIAILFSRELPAASGLLPNGQTIRVYVNGKGLASVYATDAECVLQRVTLEGLTTEFGTWSKNGEKLDGYYVEILVPYAALGVTADTAKGNISICPVLYSAYGSIPAQSATLEGLDEDNQKTFPVLTDDNTIRDNKFKNPAQLGSFGSVSQGQYWDLSKDYFKEDKANYPNREVLLTGHDGNDNNLVFYRVNGREMYVRATLTLTGVSNPNDQWPKFGLMLFDGENKKGVFYYVDAIMNNNSGNTLANIVGTAVGYNHAPGGEVGYNGAAWITSKDGVFNLETKSIVMEMVYQDGWVHMYADGNYINSIEYGEYNENLRFGIKSFGIDLKVTDYLASTDAEADGWADKKRVPPGNDVEYDGEANDAIWTEEVLANTQKFGDKGDGRYFTVAAVKGSDGVYFLVNTYTFENTRQSVNWWENANIEFRFGNDLNTQQYFYVDGVGFNGIKTTAGIARSVIKTQGNEGDIYHNTFEFFAPYDYFPGYDANAEEIPLKVWGWVWDAEGWRDIMNVGGYPELTISEHGLRFERSISVEGTNAGLSVDVQGTAKRGDTVVATVNVAEGQELSYVKINGVEHEVVDGKVTFIMPEGDATISVALKGIGVSNSIDDKSGEGLSATVNCESATATVGQTITFTVHPVAGAKILAVSVNGELVEATDGTYSYTVKATDIAVAIKVELDYDLSEAIDGVKSDAYGTPITMKAEGGRKFNVWARSDDHGVYFYFEAISGTLANGATDFWGNNNFEFRLNGADHGGVNTKGEIYRASKGVYNYVQLENGMYHHTAEVYVNGAKWIPNFNSENTVLQYAFKTPGEFVWHENMVNNQWNRTDWWRSGHGTPYGDEPVALGQPNGLSQCIHITKSGIVHDCERASIDGDLSEYPVNAEFIGKGDEHAKVDIVGYVANDGVYLGLTVYQNMISEKLDWWNTDNFEIKLLGDRAGFTIVEDFIAGCAPISDYAMIRTDGGDSGYAYKTVIELFYAYDFSTAKQASFQIALNGFGFRGTKEDGWQAFAWDGNVARITENGIEWVALFLGWPEAQLYVADKMAEGEGLTIDGMANEDLYRGLPSVTYDVNGAQVVLTAKKLSTGIATFTTITHKTPASQHVQGDGTAWWNYLNIEFRMGGNTGTQFATSTMSDWRAYCASKYITTDNGDGTYTTTFETFLPFTTEYGGMNYRGDVQLAFAVVAESGWVRLTGNDWAPTNLYVNENGLVKK